MLGVGTCKHHLGVALVAAPQQVAERAAGHVRHGAVGITAVVLVAIDVEDSHLLAREVVAVLQHFLVPGIENRGPAGFSQAVVVRLVAEPNDAVKVAGDVDLLA